MIFLVLLFLSAFLISSVSAYFSISGLTAIFPNAVLPIVSMGIVLEMGKLVTASFVYQYWNKYKALTRSVLLGMTITLSLLSSVGVYGYLSRKHIEGTTGIAGAVDNVSFVQKQIDMEQSNITFLQQSMAQGDKVVNNYLTDTSKTIRADAARTKLLKERKTTQAEIVLANKNLLELQHQKDSLSQIQRVKEVDVGPLKYLAALISPDTNMDVVVRWFILTLVFVLDPLAILLVIAGNIHRRETKNDTIKRPEFVTGLSIVPNTSVPVEPQTPEKVENVEAVQVKALQPLVSGVVTEVTQESIMEVTQESPPQELDFTGHEKWMPQPLDKRIIPH
jgi:3-dehydroquinate dehydratase